MGEKATIFQTIQIGVETVAGTPVPADKKLQTVSLVPAPKTATDVVRAFGNKYPFGVTLNKEWSTLKIDGVLSYNDVLYLLSSLLSLPTPVQQGTSDAYKWTFTSSTSSEDAGISLTVEQGDGNTAWRVAGSRVSGLEFTFKRDEVRVSGDAIGGKLETGIVMTDNPTTLTPRPVLPTHLMLYMADTQGDLDSASAVRRGFSLIWKLTDKIGLFWPIGQDPVTVEVEPTLEAVLNLATDDVGLSLIQTMRSGSTKWFRIKATGDAIESYHHTFQIDFPAQVKEVGEFSDEDGLYLVEYTLQGVHDSTWGKPFQIDVITDVEAL